MTHPIHDHEVEKSFDQKILSECFFILLICYKLSIWKAIKKFCLLMLLQHFTV
jgi:hypothetical protein